MAELFLAGEGSLWVQFGPNQRPRYLGCHEIGDVDEPQGDVTTLYCPDPSATGKYKAVGSFSGEPGAIEFSITTDVTETADWLERLTGTCNIFVHKVKSGRRDQFANFERSFAMLNCRLTERGLAGLAAREPGNEARSTQTFGFNAQAILRLLPLFASSVTISGSGALSCVDIAPPQLSAVGTAESGFAAIASGAAGTSTKAPLYVTTDGSTWSSLTAPFAAGEDTKAVSIAPVAPGLYRYFVGMTETASGKKAQVAVSSGGTSWAITEFGATGEYIAPRGLVALSAYTALAIVRGTANDSVYLTTDGGENWTKVLGVTGHLYHIANRGEDLAVVGGTSGQFRYSTDGGSTWESIPISGAGDIRVVAIQSDDLYWAADSNGSLYYYANGTWSTRALPIVASSIEALAFEQVLVGYIIANDGSSDRVFRTIDGGYSWQELTAPGADVSDLAVVGINDALVVGGGTDGLIVRYVG